jgi:hypothetical protein
VLGVVTPAYWTAALHPDRIMLVLEIATSQNPTRHVLPDLPAATKKGVGLLLLSCLRSLLPVQHQPRTCGMETVGSTFCIGGKSLESRPTASTTPGVLWSIFPFRLIFTSCKG